MQCSCGGETREKKIVRGGKTVCEYQRCTSCGRQHVTKGQYPKDKDQADG